MRGLFQSRAAAMVWWGVVCCSVIVGAIMIERSSTIAVDGHRYFALFDDGMITMRYADNLVSGRGLVWNPGERIEGFSSPLWVFVLAGFIALFGRLRAVAAVQVFGLLLALVDLLLVLLIARRLLDGRRGQDIGALAAVFLTMTFYPLFFWSIMGMETGLLVPLVLLAVHLALRPEPSSRNNHWIAVVLSLGCLLRPETALFVVIFYLFEIARRRRTGPLAVKPLAVEALLFATPLVGYQVFRLLYYKQWYANSYRLKLQGLQFVDEVAHGWQFSEPFLLWAGWLALAVALFLAWSAGRRLRMPDDRHSARDMPPTPTGYLAEFLSIFIAYAGYQVAIGGDAWPLYIRFPAPATLLLVIAFTVSVVLFFDRMRRSTLWTTCVLGLSFLLVLRWTASLYRADLFTLTPIYSNDAATNIHVALATRRLTDESATVAAFAAGVLPYYSQRRAIDPLGKCDATIARLPVRGGVPWNERGGMPGHNKYDLEYSLKSKRPTVIQWIGSPPCTWGTQNLSTWCQENYYIVSVPGGRLLLDKQSPLVHWEMFGAKER
jgi:hypothetical protein